MTELRHQLIRAPSLEVDPKHTSESEQPFCQTTFQTELQESRTSLKNM